MSQSPLADALAELAAPLAASLGLELWGIELGFGGRSLVRVYVEVENGVSIDQCAELSRLLGLTLDVEDVIPGAYVLEVSSPGLERTFFTAGQLARTVGQRVEITLHQPFPSWPGRRKFRGLLQKAPEPSLPDGGEGGDLVGAPGVSGDASNPRVPVSGAPAALFTLKAEDLARPDEEEPLITFVFADLKKAVQVHSFPGQGLPGKNSGNRRSGGKVGKSSEKRGASRSRHSDPATGDPEAREDDC